VRVTLLLAAAVAWGEMTVPPDKGVEPAEPKQKNAERMGRIRALAEDGRREGGASLPVAVYTLHGKADLPPTMIVVDPDSMQAVVMGLMDALLEPGWRSSGRYWVGGLDEAVRRLAKGMKLGRRDWPELKATVKREMGNGFCVVYRYREGAEAEEGVPVLSPDAVRGSTAPASAVSTAPARGVPAPW
jgi:hypothetical protein